MNTFAHQCRHCEGIDKIPRAIACFCSACNAEPGDRCVDMRTTTTTRRPVGYLHPERQELLIRADSPSLSGRLTSRPVETFIHMCSHCGQDDEIPRPEAFFCRKCKARPGEACVDARTFATTRKPAGYTHIVRQSLLDVVDALRLHSAVSA